MYALCFVSPRFIPRAFYGARTHSLELSQATIRFQSNLDSEDDVVRTLSAHDVPVYIRVRSFYRRVSEGPVTEQEIGYIYIYSVESLIFFVDYRYVLPSVPTHTRVSAPSPPALVL